MKHARRQVLEYIAERLTAQIGIVCSPNKVVLNESGDSEHVDVYIEDELVSGDDAEDEFQNTLDVLARTTPLVVRVSVKGAPLSPDDRADELAGLVEVALAGDNEDGGHLVSGAQISCQYAGASLEKDDDPESELVRVSMIFSTSYRTEVGKPFVLV